MQVLWHVDWSLLFDGHSALYSHSIVPGGLLVIS
jgi:hypothetical protein